MSDSRRDEIVARAHRVLKYDFLPTHAPERILAQDVLTLHGWLCDKETEEFDRAMEQPVHTRSGQPPYDGRSE